MKQGPWKFPPWALLQFSLNWHGKGIVRTQKICSSELQFHWENAFYFLHQIWFKTTNTIFWESPDTKWISRKNKKRFRKGEWKEPGINGFSYYVFLNTWVNHSEKYQIICSRPSPSQGTAMHHLLCFSVSQVHPARMVWPLHFQYSVEEKNGNLWEWEQVKRCVEIRKSWVQATLCQG